MEPVIVPRLTVSFAVDLEVEYNSFCGRTPEDIADALQDELDDFLFDRSPAFKAVFTSITAIDSHD